MSKTGIENNQLRDRLEEILKQEPKYVSEKSKELKLNVIKEDAENGAIELLRLLLNNSEMKQCFFEPILDSYVFKTKEFKEILEYASGCNSYSKFLGKKIGLYMGDTPLVDRDEVVLNFPFKDCVLEGGQRKEDGLDPYFKYDEKQKEFVEQTSKRREVFYNEVLAYDEIDSLFAPKALCNGRRYEKEGSTICSELKRDFKINRSRNLPDDTITDNLLIKGNNLLALHSLAKEFAGKVKLIYIDPPYNTGSDGFTYNDHFNHSSWLTFMKNRLEIARELLREDGCIFVQCDDNEQAYLKVLMDEVFGRENFIVNLIVTSAPAGSQSSNNFAVQHSYSLVYAKSVKFETYNLELTEDKLLKKYKDKDSRGLYYSERLWKRGKGGRKEDVPSLHFPVFYDKDKNKIYIDREVEIIKEKDNLIKIIPYHSKGVLGRWTWARETMKEKRDRLMVKMVNGEYKLYKKMYIEEDEGEKPKTIITSEIGRTEKGSLEIKELFNDEVFAYPKSESLLMHFLSISTKKNDIVLDFHLGSGTTAAVTHKIGRQYIGIEQMDYIETVALERLKKVIAGEQGGISKAVEWKGGGSFVYFELAKKNEKAIEEISACQNLEELISLFDELCKKYYLHYNVNIKEFRKTICTDERFQSLPLDKQKEMFCRMLDLNQLYVNADERHDETVGLSKADIQLTESFYQLNKEGR